jgi:hypothetical protein
LFQGINPELGKPSSRALPLQAAEAGIRRKIKNPVKRSSFSNKIIRS